MTYGSLRIRDRRCLSIVAALLCLLIDPCFSAPAEEPSATKLAAAYQTDIRPLMERFCHDCHGSSDTVEGDINLAAMKSWDDVAKHPKVWQQVAEMLGNGLMPPEHSEQPTQAERDKLQKWVAENLAREARTHSGDPGRVVLRRLGNAEYTYTLRDLTGVKSLDPAREFPADGAAGEGFTNTGNALVMSPALVTKYLDAAKEVASHAVLLPDGFRFSPHTTNRDWTDDTLVKIRNFYSQFTDASGGSQVNLQGMVFDTNQGGRLPVEKYLSATLAEREALTSGSKTIDLVARERGLNAKYLGILWSSLAASEPSLLLNDFRARWRLAKPEDAPALAADIAAWQKGLWNFATVGLIGRAGGPQRWQEPVNPLTTKQEIKFKVPESPDAQDVTVSLIATDAGDGNEHDFVVWHSPRLVAPGRPDLLLRDVRGVAKEFVSRRTRVFGNTSAYLHAADEMSSIQRPPDVAASAKKHGVEETSLRAWLNYLGIGTGEAVELEGRFGSKLARVAGHDFINGWGSNDTPSLMANSSDQAVRIPGNVKPHGVVAHPSPTLQAAVGWQSPLAASVRIEGTVALAHPECSNGVTWSLEVRRGATRQRLAGGTAQGPGEVQIAPLTGIVVRPGDVVSLLIGPRDGIYECDCTAIDLKVSSESGDKPQTWNLAGDVSGDVLTANPHADRFGNARRLALLRGAGGRRNWGSDPCEFADRPVASGEERRGTAEARNRTSEAADQWATGCEGQPRCGALPATSAVQRAIVRWLAR